MKPLLLVLAALAAPTRAAQESADARDPFWPVGYVPVALRPVEPPPPQPEPAPPPPEEPPKPRTPAVRPVTPDDWAAARRTLTVSGFIRSETPDTREIRVLATINRENYAQGDTVTLDHRGIRFQWRVAAVSEKGIELTPVQAVRLSADGTPPPAPTP